MSMCRCGTDAVMLARAGGAADERDEGVEPLFQALAGCSSRVIDAMSTAGVLRTGKLWLGVVPKAVHKLPNGRGKLVLSLGSVVDFEGDAIVNAANEGCLGE